MTCSLGIHRVGFVMICFGATDAFFSLTLGRLTKYTGRIPVFISGAVIHYAVIIIMLIWRPDYSLIWVFYIVAALLGYCDAVWQTQINGKTKFCALNTMLLMAPLEAIRKLVPKSISQLFLGSLPGSRRRPNLQSHKSLRKLTRPSSLLNRREPLRSLIYQNTYRCHVQSRTMVRAGITVKLVPVFIRLQ